MIDRILEMIGERSRYCVELGAWDGIHLSNCWGLVAARGWSGCLIEGDPQKFQLLQANMAAYPGIVCVNRYAHFTGPDSLDAILDAAGAPAEPDLMSIDVDGIDYHLWAGLVRHSPRVVVIEFNPSVPNDVLFVQAKDASVSQGASLLALIRLGKEKGYELVCCTYCNAFFVRKDLYPLAGLQDNSIDKLHQPVEDSRIFHGYDATAFVLGKPLSQGGTTNPARMQRLAMSLRPLRTRHEMQRLGGGGDGGYLVPLDLDGIEACFSPGVGAIAPFERDLLQGFGIGSHLADGSVEAPPPEVQALSFRKKHLGVFDDDGHITLGSWVSEEHKDNGRGDLLLQMDIEGDEYAVILATPEEILRRFRIIVLEIHDVEGWGAPSFFKLVSAFFEKLLKHFIVVHNHPNNCCGLVQLGNFVAPRVFELTLLRRDRALPLGYADRFPHPLDCPNVRGREDLVLPANWWGPLGSRNAVPPPGELDFLRGISGLIHVGANTGDERELYDHFGLRVLWIEALPLVSEALRRNLEGFPLQRSLQCLVTDRDDEQVTFHVASNGGASSSIFELAQHKEIWPNVTFSSSVSLRTSTLASLMARNGLSVGDYQALILDTQGSELLVLKGLGEQLSSFQYVLTEAANFEAYAGGCQLPDLVAYLAHFGFHEVCRRQFAARDEGGAYFDVLFERRVGA